jgi:hypothetical protein
MDIDIRLRPSDLLPDLARLWERSARSLDRLRHDWDPARGTPVFTVEGRYTLRGWTEWTEGFLYGSALLQFDATGDAACLEYGRRLTRERMAAHVSHLGVHDHGFNNVSTYGNLLRLAREEAFPADAWEIHFYELALKLSGAVQAARWTALPEGEGFLYSFNGPHSLFVDTLRSCRALLVAHALGHRLMGENDLRVSLLRRALLHARATARWSVYYGEGRDAYDESGRTVHECLFNVNDGRYRCPSTQQGYSPFSTWTRGLAWAMCGFAEFLEFLDALPDAALAAEGGRAEWEALFTRAARATCDYFLRRTPTDGIPYWDNGAPGLALLPDPFGRPADPFNDHEPVDSSAAAIACQGLLRFGRRLQQRGDPSGEAYFSAGLTVLRRLTQPPYLNADDHHQGLLLHAVYHRPNGWDHIPPGRRVPCGESCLWGDYHLREAGLLVQRLAQGGAYPTFFGGVADRLPQLA